MDEIVYQRETLRRALTDLGEQLDKAAQVYDPAKDVPEEDFIAAMIAAALGRTVREYSKAIMYRLESRKERH